MRSPRNASGRLPDEGRTPEGGLLDRGRLLDGPVISGIGWKASVPYAFPRPFRMALAASSFSNPRIRVFPTSYQAWRPPPTAIASVQRWRWLASASATGAELTLRRTPGLAHEAEEVALRESCLRRFSEWPDRAADARSSRRDAAYSDRQSIGCYVGVHAGCRDAKAAPSRSRTSPRSCLDVTHFWPRIPPCAPPPAMVFATDLYRA